MRLGDLDALKDHLEDLRSYTALNKEHAYYRGETNALKIAIRNVENAPTVDAVPVVRCKDCKWWDGRTWDEKGEPLYGYCNACKHGHYSSNWEISIFRKYKADWFCADGERMSE